MRSILLVPLLASAALSTAACGGGPTPGVWHYKDFGTASNTCNSDQVNLHNGDFRIYDVEGSAFQVDPMDGGDDFECELDGDDFDCPDRHVDSVDIDAQGVQATLAIQVRATGTFDDPEEASGEQIGTVTCTGSGCDAVAAFANTSFPCQISVDYTAVLDEAE